MKPVYGHPYVSSAPGVELTYYEKRKRGGPRFSLMSLLVLVTGFAIGFGLLRYTWPWLSGASYVLVWRVFQVSCAAVAALVVVWIAAQIIRRGMP